MKEHIRHFGFALAAALAPVNLPTASAQAPLMYVARQNQILKLQDITGDGDYLDPLEVTIHANPTVTAGSRITGAPKGLWLLTPTPPLVTHIHDVNGDGDAVDAGEIETYALLTAAAPATTPVARAMAVQPDGALLVADAANGRLIRVIDHNGDGDAADFAEMVVIADNLTQPVSIDVRPDGALLVAQDNAAVPVRILRDLNGDGDYFGFAENLSYLESDAAVAHLMVESDARSYAAQPAPGALLLLHDVTGDDDVLDAGEQEVFATGLTGLAAIARDGATGDFYAAIGNDIIRVRDENGDGDAVDPGERVTVASGITQMRALYIPVVDAGCKPGDADGNGVVDIEDAMMFAHRLVDGPAPAPACTLDMNADGRLDGRDIAPFVAAMLP